MVEVERSGVRPTGDEEGDGVPLGNLACRKAPMPHRRILLPDNRSFAAASPVAQAPSNWRHISRPAGQLAQPAGGT